jgi:hypothetical protein
MQSETKDLGPLTRHYFRILSGHDAAEDGPEVAIIRSVRRVPPDFTFKTYGGITFCVREDKHKSLGYDCTSPIVDTLLGGK